MKKRLYEILEGSPQAGRAGRIFHLSLISLIILNVVALTLETVRDIEARGGYLFWRFEVFSVAVFSVEYLLRLWACTSSPRFASPVAGRLKYMLTPMAIADLLAVLPFYVPRAGLDLRVLRTVRLFRFFRVVKLGRHSTAARTLGRVLYGRREELWVTLFGVLIVLVIASALMYYAENEAQPDKYSSIPASMWWAVSTLTTVGYGDIYPVTTAGKILACVIAVIGIGLFALPAGILGSGFMSEMQRRPEPPVTCPHCGKETGERRSA